MISSILIKTKRKEGINIMNNYGFTLIELLVVIAIIGTLSTIGFLALTLASDGADDAKSLAELQQVRSAATVELSKNRKYPIVKTGSTECASIDTHDNLSDIKTQLQNVDHTKYWYCSDGTGDKFLVATELKGTLPEGNRATDTTFGTTSGSAGTATVPVVCKKTTSPPAPSGVYCVGSL